MTKTIELHVRIAVQVSEEIADAAANDPDLMCVDIPLAQLQLLRDTTPVEGKFVEYETMITEVVSE